MFKKNNNITATAIISTMEQTSYTSDCPLVERQMKQLRDILSRANEVQSPLEAQAILDMCDVLKYERDPKNRVSLIQRIKREPLSKIRKFLTKEHVTLFQHCQTDNLDEIYKNIVEKGRLALLQYIQQDLKFDLVGLLFREESTVYMNRLVSPMKIYQQWHMMLYIKHNLHPFFHHFFPSDKELVNSMITATGESDAQKAIDKYVELHDLDRQDWGDFRPILVNPFQQQHVESQQKEEDDFTQVD